MTTTLTGAASIAHTSPRRFYSPVQQDAATFLETAEESGGVRTLLEIEVAPGGGNGPHTHDFAERFTVLDGVLTVLLGDEDHDLHEGESAEAPAGTVHRFRNLTGETVTFEVEIRPGHRGFERALQIGYGLAADGRTNAEGVPRNPLILGLLAETGGVRLVGPLGMISPVLRVLARIAQRRGLDRELSARYCRV